MILCPEPPSDVRQVFRSSRAWEFNVCGASVAGIAGSALIAVVGAIVAASAHVLRSQLVGIGLIVTAVALVSALWLGHLAAGYPYAIQVEEGQGIYLYAPFGTTYFDLRDIKHVRWSYLRTGWVMTLKKRHGLLKTITIHAAFGKRGRDCAAAVEEEIRKHG